MLGKLLAWLKMSEAPKDEQRHDRSGVESKDGSRDPEGAAGDAESEAVQPGSEALSHSPTRPEDRTSVPIMVEILKLLSRIEYGMDEEQIANALAISEEDARANCDALEQEMFVHHHDTLAEWFIWQRGLEFLRLHGHLE